MDGYLRTWDFQSMQSAVDEVGTKISVLVEHWEATKPLLNTEMMQLRERFVDKEYPEALEMALRQVGVVFSGAFAEGYELPPFRLYIETDGPMAKLVMGRKQYKSGELEPNTLAKWIWNHQQSLLKRKFDSQRFCQELLSAYEYANRLAYRQEKVLFGRAVDLNVIYQLLTIKRSSKKEYPLEQFIYDLGRLKEQFEIAYRDYRFEFGYSRNQKKAFQVVDSQGKTSRISSLNIHLEAKNDGPADTQ